MKKIYLLFGISCMLTACGEKQPVIESTIESTIQNTEPSSHTEPQNTEPSLEETSNSTDMTDVIGIPVLLPENTNWIVNREYTQLDENSLEVTYYDDILEADCIVLVVKDGTPDLPDHDYDETLDELWSGYTITGKQLTIKVQHSIDKKKVLATWKYNNYSFAIIGSISDEQSDSSPIPKTAGYIIQHLE